MDSPFVCLDVQGVLDLITAAGRPLIETLDPVQTRAESGR